VIQAMAFAIGSEIGIAIEGGDRCFEESVLNGTFREKSSAMDAGIHQGLLG
jgi:hypothetical protein